MFFSSAGLIACKDVGFFEAFSCPWTPSPAFYKLLEIERALLHTQSVAQRIRLRSPARVHAVVRGLSSAAGGVSPARHPTSRGR
jgi:hypothetical protein